MSVTALIAIVAFAHGAVQDTTGMEPQVARKIQEAQKAVEEAPASSELWGRLGLVLHAHERNDEAVAAYERALELASDELRWAYLLARVLENVEPSRALHFAERASVADSSYAPAHLLRGRLLESANEMDEARTAYEKALAANPNSASAAFALGRLSLASGDLTPSQRYLERAAQRQPRASAIQASLARVYLLQGEEEKAQLAAEKAKRAGVQIFELDPVLNSMRDEMVSSVGFQIRANRAEARGELDRAEALYRELLVIRPEEANFHQNFASFLVRRSEPREAERHYLRALELDPGYVLAHVNLGKLFMRQRRAPEAVPFYRKALELEAEPGSASLHFDLAVALAASGDFRSAWEHVHAAQSLGHAAPSDFLAALAEKMPEPQPN